MYPAGRFPGSTNTCSGNNNKDEDNRPKILNDKNLSEMLDETSEINNRLKLISKYINFLILYRIILIKWARCTLLCKNIYHWFFIFENTPFCDSFLPMRFPKTINKSYPNLVIYLYSLLLWMLYNYSLIFCKSYTVNRIDRDMRQPNYWLVVCVIIKENTQTQISVPVVQNLTCRPQRAYI